MPKPWKVTRSVYKHSDQWLRFRTDTCVTESGHVLESFHVLELPDWINVIALTPDHQLVLVNEYRHGAKITAEALPSGTVDPEDTDPIETAQRELEEETGYVSQEVHFVGVSYPNPAMQNNRVWTYLALNARATGQQSLDPSEDLEVALRPLSQYLQDIAGGRIPVQATHSAAFFFARQFLGRSQDPKLRELAPLFA
jgi:ADP-ribose pyrophosphatase